MRKGVKRFKIFKVISWGNETEIPLNNFGALSPDKTKFIFNFNSNTTTLLSEYYSLLPILHYTIGPESNDEYRRNFIQYVNGSEYYPGNFKIKLQNGLHSTIPSKPMFPHTCLNYIDVYKIRRNMSKSKNNSESNLEILKLQINTNRKNFGEA